MSRLLFGLPGCVLVLVSTFMPAVLLATLSFMRTVNPRLEEAARLSARPRRVLWGITIPLIRPGILLIATLVFLLALGEFGVPTFLRYNVFAVESFAQFSAFYNFGAAAAAAVPLALLTFVVLGIEWFVLREKTQALRPTPESGGTVVVQLGGTACGSSCWSVCSARWWWWRHCFRCWCKPARRGPTSGRSTPSGIVCSTACFSPPLAQRG
jgi:iron(III) transport system permease protein